VKLISKQWKRSAEKELYNARKEDRKTENEAETDGTSCEKRRRKPQTSAFFRQLAHFYAQARRVGPYCAAFIYVV
jgi:hypothetical protein